MELGRAEGVEEAPLSTLPALPEGFATPFKVEPLKIIKPSHIGQLTVTLAVLFGCWLKERKRTWRKTKNKAFCAMWKRGAFCWNLLK